MTRREQGDRRAVRAMRSELARYYRDGRWFPPPTSECEVDTVLTEPDATTLVVNREMRWRGQLVEYAIVLKVADAEGGWREVIAIDTAQHGCVHRHRGSHDETPWTMIRPIRSQADVADTWNASWDEIWNEYERLDQEEHQ